MITIVYDNQLHNRNLKSGWGFSCLVEHSGRKILFDTGDNAEKLSFNLNKLKINPEQFEAIVCSHNHWDHTGGLGAVLGQNRHCRFYFGKSYPDSFQAKMKAQGINFILVNRLTAIIEKVFVGPELAGFGLKEIALTIKTEKGLVVITGCAHPGILKILQRLKEEFDTNIYLALGGFHLGMSLGLKAIVEGFGKMGVQKVAPCHCTGARAISLFEEKFKNDFINVGAGLQIEIS